MGNHDMNNPMDLSGGHYLVTGASSGIGRGTALVLDELGATLVLAGRREDELAKTAAALSRPARIEKMDLARMSDLPSWLKRVAAETGPLDGIVHCAGIQVTTPLRYISEQQFQNTLDVNLKSAVGLAKGYRQKGVCRTPGSIVFISSIASLFGIPGQTAYAASKAGLEAACRCIASELARENIRVNTILPGLVRTEMTEKWVQIVPPEKAAQLSATHPLGLGEVNDIAYTAAFLLGKKTGRWISGASIVIDGGSSECLYV
ncbi:MAG: SDR family oxidoreductase [Chrysiogenales bacterium]|nr:MAG: SDR family oxidoreductase [Chrysiogenales bacterium]